MPPARAVVKAAMIDCPKVTTMNHTAKKPPTNW